MTVKVYQIMVLKCDHPGCKETVTLTGETIGEIRKKIPNTRWAYYWIGGIQIVRCYRHRALRNGRFANYAQA